MSYFSADKTVIESWFPTKLRKSYHASNSYLYIYNKIHEKNMRSILDYF